MMFRQVHFGVLSLSNKPAAAIVAGNRKGQFNYLYDDLSGKAKRRKGTN
jgi:hypothetical protein